MADESQFLSVIRVWAAMAWADGIMADAEAEAMRRLIGTAELNDEERATALSWIDRNVDLDIEPIKALAESARTGIYRAALRLATVDLELAEEEVSFLDRLRTGLDIDPQVAKELADSLAPAGDAG